MNRSEMLSLFAKKNKRLIKDQCSTDNIEIERSSYIEGEAREEALLFLCIGMINDMHKQRTLS